MEDQNKKMNRALLADGGLPDELYLENVLPRLPAKDLAICSCVCKLWYETIHKDSRFVTSHFIQGENKVSLVFKLLNVMYPKEERLMHYFFKLEKEYDDDEFHSYRHFMEFGFDYFYRQEVVGYCNGLTCLKAESKSNHKEGSISIVNPTRAESFTLYYVTPTYADGWGLCNYLGHGFGFDSLSHRYKVVIVFGTPYSVRKNKFSSTTSREADHQDIVCLVLTLGGTNSWRKIVTSISQISPPPAPGSSPFPSPMLTKGSVFTYKSATLCGGDLYWRMTYSSATSKNDEIEMLLSFDIHNEKIQLIPLPPDQCSLTPPTANGHLDLVVDHHLLEFKGCPCVARSEVIKCHPCNDRSSSGSCRCSVKVHLHALKDKVNQVWNKGEILDVQIEEEGLQPFCWQLDTTTTKPYPRARMLSFSGQLLLYWFNGKCLTLYNLQTKHHKIIKCCGKWIRNIFEIKKKEEHLVNGPYPGDYQLHGQVENILSLKTFLPEGETTKFYFYSWNDFGQIMRKGDPFAGWMSAARESVKVRCFF